MTVDILFYLLIWDQLCISGPDIFKGIMWQTSAVCTRCPRKMTFTNRIFSGTLCLKNQLGGGGGLLKESIIKGEGYKFRVTQ